MSEWKTVSLGKVTSYIAKGIPPTYVKEESEQTVCVLNQKCNRDFRISYKESRLHNNVTRKVPEAKMLMPGDVLINSTGTGTAGRVAQIWNVPIPTTIDGHMILMRPTEEVDPLYYGYVVKAYQTIIESYAEGSTGQTEINKDRLLNEIVVNFPVDKQKQYKIGRVLADLDDKIIENEQINKNLEDQLYAYYHELFINNTNCQWKQCSIADLGTVVGGSTPSKKHSEYYTNDGIAWVTPKDLSNNHSKFISHGENDITNLGLANSSASIIPEGSVLFSSRAPIGYIAITINSVTTNQGFKSVIPNENIGSAFVYYFLKNNLTTIENMASGSTFKEVSGSTMKSVPAFVPDENTLTIFKNFCEPIFGEQKNLEAQNRHLSQLRDLLLPRLMSGKLDIPNINL